MSQPQLLRPDGAVRTAPAGPPPTRRRASVVAAVGALLYAAGVVSATVITSSDQFHEEPKFSGVEEVVSVLLLMAMPGAFLLALGLSGASRTPLRRTASWIVAGLLLAVVPLFWQPYWSGGQGVFLPVVSATGVVGVLYGLAKLVRVMRDADSAARTPETPRR